jgi:hypothetical protein
MALMAEGSSAGLADRQRAALDSLVADLRAIFGARLHALVVYGAYGLHSFAPDGQGGYIRTLGLVERVTFDDLTRLVPLVSRWQQSQLAVPLILSRHEFERSLDVFPLEYGSIIANHLVIFGDAPLAGVRVADADRRRGCEQQAKSHLVHLREGFLETGGEQRAVGRLIAASAPAFRTVLTHLVALEDARMQVGAVDTGALAAFVEREIGVPAPLVVEVLATSNGMSTIADPSALLARYIDASERIWRYVDGHRA